MPQEDAELLRACRRGDESAWEALVQRYQRLVFAVPRRAGLDEDAAAEVFQEVFTTLFQKLEEIEQPDRLHAWLVTTARRKTWRVIVRERGTFTSGVADDEQDEMLQVPDPALLPDQVLSELQEQHRVRTAVATLDGRCRQLIGLLFYASETPAYAAIAAELQVPEGSIGPTRARCLKKLMQLLKD